MAIPSSLRRKLRTRLFVPWLLVAAIWTVVIIASLSGQRVVIDHHYLLEESGLPWPLATALFLIGWQVMVLAMMAPSSILTMAQSPADRVRAAIPYRALAEFFVGYACAWTVFGFLAFTGDTLIHRLVDEWPWLAAHSLLIGVVTLVIAGLFQFTPWKSACLARCQSLHSSFTHTMEPRLLWQQGMRHGATSVGCCWALMLVMFGIGMGGLGWMAALTVVMVGEIAMPGAVRSRRICQAVGVALLLLAGLYLAHPGWIVPITTA